MEKSEYVKEIFIRLSKHNPDPKTELNYLNPFTLLIAVMFSAQTTDIAVNKATKNLFVLADHPEKMRALGEEKIIEQIKSIGLYKTKAKNAVKISEILIEKFGSEIPKNKADLTSLPGVGNKTANVVLNELYDFPLIAVDTHIFRLAHRLELSNGKNPDSVERDLTAIIPEEFLRSAHHQLILHGRYVCKAIKPLCCVCILSDICRYTNKNIKSGKICP